MAYIFVKSESKCACRVSNNGRILNNMILASFSVFIFKIKLVSLPFPDKMRIIERLKRIIGNFEFAEHKTY